ncbi:hypothetical protein [Nonomuraea sp. NPDC050310]|uniref:hypothetical protein n=1 Tax=unclassified Nonomuraea TaxID=2593643 RepID=UPI0033DE8822
MLRRIVIGALAAGAFLAVSSTAASAATWSGGDNEDNVGNYKSPASIVVPIANHAVNGNEVDVLTLAHLERINANVLTNDTAIVDAENVDG